MIMDDPGSEAMIILCGRSSHVAIVFFVYIVRVLLFYNAYCENQDEGIFHITSYFTLVKMESTFMAEIMSLKT